CADDGKDVGVDLSGGYYDAGDYIKVTYPLVCLVAGSVGVPRTSAEPNGLSGRYAALGARLANQAEVDNGYW
ncbi:hypothetical protein MPER_05172, partial [Moniliophthora perniciosa FA553]